MSENVLTNCLRDLGYPDDVMSVHSFRGAASTILREKNWNSEVTELQVAHLTGIAISRAYNRSFYLAERTNLMQEWSNYLDILSRAD